MLALDPKNALVRQQLDSTQKIMRKAEFEKAIEMEEEASPVERCLAIIAEGESVTRLDMFRLMTENQVAAILTVTTRAPRYLQTATGNISSTLTSSMP